ncbi:hypothetical protein TNCT_81051 [Trichonephila clavata]|uniref:Uncharacterized protein n=1 Tax=Trichonephila clavata TaxID=2740835 RepID=A0A8X6K664_TRICU|nr:hypothetical protein TNCT_81051 [Trichonephila clavata]
MDSVKLVSQISDNVKKTVPKRKNCNLKMGVSKHIPNIIGKPDPLDEAQFFSSDVGSDEKYKPNYSEKKSP